MLPGSGETHAPKSSVTYVTRVTRIVNYLYSLGIIVVTLPFGNYLISVTGLTGVTLQENEGGL